MREWNESASGKLKAASHHLIELPWSEKSANCHRTDEHNDVGIDSSNFIVEKGATQGELPRRRRAIAIARGTGPRKAAGQGGEPRACEKWPFVTIAG